MTDQPEWPARTGGIGSDFFLVHDAAERDITCNVLRYLGELRADNVIVKFSAAIGVG